KYLVNYADQRYYQAQRKNRESGLAIGGFDECFALGRSDLDADFVAANKLVLSQPKGAGYWLWKAHIIAKTLNNINAGDLLFYSDAGADFINNIDTILPFLEATEEKLLLFSMDGSLANVNWTKRDCFVLMDLDRE